MPDIKDVPIPARIKLMLAADSGAGKTGVLATLANAGYHVRILDFDGNLRIINSYLKPDMTGSIKYIHLPVMADDKSARRNKSVLAVKSILENGWRVDKEDLGKISTWGPDTILVVDTLTFFGQAAMRHACLMSGINPDEEKGIPQPVWGVAQKIVMAVVQHLCGPDIKCSVVFNTHLRYLEDDTGVMRCYPNVLGSALSPVIGQNFTDVWRIDVRKDGTRGFLTQSDTRMSLKSSDPTHIKREEEFDLGKLFKRMLG